MAIGDGSEYGIMIYSSIHVVTLYGEAGLMHEKVGPVQIIYRDHLETKIVFDRQH